MWLYSMCYLVAIKRFFQKSLKNAFLFVFHSYLRKKCGTFIYLQYNSKSLRTIRLQLLRGATSSNVNALLLHTVTFGRLWKVGAPKGYTKIITCKICGLNVNIYERYKYKNPACFYHKVKISYNQQRVLTNILAGLEFQF